VFADQFVGLVAVEVGEHWEMVYREEDVPEVREEILPAVERAGYWHGTTTSLRADGTTVVVDHTLATTERGELVCTVRNLSERRTRERELETERTFVEQALDIIDDVFYVVGTDGELRRWNDRFAAVTGYTDDELAGMHATAFFPESERSTVADAIETTLATGGTVVEADLLTADGGRTRYEFTGDRLTDPDGEVIGLIGTGRDVSERRAREERLRQERDRLDEFARVVSHDLRNPLNVAQARLDMARQDCDSDHLEEVVDAHDRMAGLIEGLLGMARDGEALGETAPVDLGRVADACWHGVATRDATLRIDVDRTVRADESRLRQLLENLYRNAVEHGDAAVTVTVGELEDGFYVEDGGPGIPESQRHELFQAGYSTTEEGTGSGLAIVQQVADAHGWDVRVTGDADGARFEFTGVERVK
jgi:PAS domain S-box-containing protein